MEKELDELAPSVRTAARTIHSAFKILRDAGGQLSGKEVIEKIRNTLEFNDWEKERYEKTGYVRWEAILQFYSVNCTKAGFLIKKKGIWYLTPEGTESIKLGPAKLIQTVSEAYRIWASQAKQNKETEGIETTPEDEISDDNPESQKANLDLLEAQASEGIRSYIKNKNPYEFQELVAALLRAMGYYTPFISPKGKDGGIDIIAYSDPLGATTPRLKVQVKHRPEASIPVDDIRSLAGLLNSDGEIGLFVTSGQFSAEAIRFSQQNQKHIKLLNGDELINLWQEFYPKMKDEDKNLLPLYPIYFLGSNE